MKVTDLYVQYYIPPGLQQHQLTVAALGKYIVDHWQGPAIDGQSVITALLVHDLGNLVKFDLTEGATVLDSTLMTNEWRERQQHMRDKYGRNSHQATLQILRELGLPEIVQQLAAEMDASDVCRIAQDSLEQQMCEYADLRVVPSGITSLAERLADLRQRYSHHPGWDNETDFQQNVECAKLIEERLQQQTNVDITHIPPEKIETYLVELPLFEIQTDTHHEDHHDPSPLSPSNGHASD